MRFVACLVIWLLAGEGLTAGTPEDRSQSANVPSADQRPAGEWEILFGDEMTLDEYSRQIDFFKIEIGAVSSSGKIEYISKVGKSRPERRVGNAATDYRWRTSWRKGSLHVADRKLLAKAGISSQDKELLHYFPIEVQSRMAVAERAFAHRPASDILRTRFQIRPKGEGYEFVVVEQDGKSEAKPPVAHGESSNKPPTR